MTGPAPWPAGYDRRLLASVDSTMAEAARVAPGLAGPTWLLALEQTAARGRRGRAWRNPAGNFAATLVLRPSGDLGQAALRSFVASLALHDALAAVSGRAEALALKWPNDVLLGGGKVAGILLESLHVAGAVHLAIGIGVNLRAAPAAAEVEPGAVAPVDLLSMTGADVSPEAFLDALAAAYAAHEARFVTYGFAPIRTAWLARAARRGETITARTSRDTHTGRFADVDNQGQLVLDTGTGRLAIPAGDVFF
jgi:BirA family biotin operon repressor/biotin-[acetyl-CoA-carboxylase] ligase